MAAPVTNLSPETRAAYWKSEADRLALELLKARTENANLRAALQRHRSHAGPQRIRDILPRLFPPGEEG